MDKQTADKGQTSKARSASRLTVSSRAASPVIGQLEIQRALANPLSASSAQLAQLQHQYGNRAVQRLIQRAQANVQRAAPIGLEGGTVRGDLQSQINSAQGGGQSLDKNAGSQIGGAMGADFSGVRVHTDSKADNLNRSLSAKAFTLGNDVFFSKGAYNPGTRGGKQLLAHELTHVVQQGGSKSNKVQTKLTVGPAGDKYEAEADQVAAKIMKSPAGTLSAPLEGAETIARNFVAPHIMRYSAPNSDYAIGHPVDARSPFTLNEDKASVMPRTGGGVGLGAGWKSTKPGKPPLFIADDRSMAINSAKGEPREFYARQALIDESNHDLETAQSPVRLAKAGNTITLNGDHEALQMVQPRKADGELPGADQFITLTTTTCRDVASHIMGSGGYNFAKIGGERVPGFSTSSPTVLGGTHGVAKTMAEGGSVEESKTAMREGEESEGLQVGKPYGKALGRDELTDRARALGVNQFAKAGVGEAYTTQRIENAKGDSLRTDFSQDEHGGTTHDFTWGYHFAAVVAQSLDKADQITLENYNRAGDQEEARKLLLAQLENDFAHDLVDFLRDKPAPDMSIDESTLPIEPQARDEARKLRENANDKLRRQRVGEILHWLEHRALATKTEAETAYKAMESERLSKGTTMWYFRMVGSQGGQSFHEQMAGSHYFSNPLTLAVGGARVSGQTPIGFAKAKRTLLPDQIQMVRFLGQRYLTDRAMGHAKRLRVTGYASGQGFGTAKRKARNERETALARANAIRAQLVIAGVDNGSIDVVHGAADPTWTPVQRRKAVIEAV